MISEIKNVMQSALEFNVFLIEDFQRNFDNEVISITADQNLPMYQHAYDKISPLRV